ncbi:hypothetical protein, conserved [Babesia bigemina]|uniref:C3H1-type domain-containing protein n=1 Tax=Babesia bigemina TaxID=5866 RepID=A0A061BLH0_BABBI|nr:hypothetical protein, conserved [Babesia bigemina]CDR71721.1 hypothetical protein, conserved [Babesia bigemina]|eukprot:XP_012770667.1 hypothetical protein, conserved [Babesia bigemina]
MGFLFSIITDVNKNENLKKYNDNLNGILEKIKLAKYNRNNFDSSIREVSQGIKAWVRGVEERNESITKPLANLEKTLHGHASVEMDDNPITDQLSTWQGFSSIYLQEVEKSEIALDEIDDELRNEIAPKIELIKQVVDNFWNSVNDLGVYDSVKKLKVKFGAIPKIVNMEIGTQIQEVNNTLNDKFEKMFRDIHNLTQNKKSHINSIRKAVQSAKQLADTLVDDSTNVFDKKYKANISDRFNEIKAKIEKFCKVNGDGQPTLFSEFYKVRTKVEGLETDVRHGLGELKQEINGLTKDMNDSNLIVKEALQQLETDREPLYRLTFNGANSIVTLTKGLEGKFQKVIQQDLKSSISEVDNAIRKLGATFGVGVGGDKKLRSILEHLRTQIGTIKGSDYEDKGCSAIVARVKSYAAKFTKSKFGEKVLDGWIGDILKEDSVVKTRIEEYIKDNNGTNNRGMNGVGTNRFTNPLIKADELHNPLKTEIKTVLNSEVIQKATENFNDAQDSVEKNLNGLHGVCTAFATELGKVIDGKDAEIARQVDNQVRDNSKGVTEQSDLKTAVKYILQRLVSRANKFASDIGNLIKECEFSNVDAPSNTAVDLYKKLYDAMNAGVDGKLSEMRSKIRDLDNIFTKGVKNELQTETNNIERVLNNFNSNVKERIKDAAEKAIEQAVGKFGSNGIMNLEQLMGQFHQSERALQSSVKQIENQLNILKTFPSAVDSKRKNAEEIMKTLKTEVREISAKIEAIDPILIKAENVLGTAIQTLERSLEDTRKYTTLVLPLLQQNLQQHVTNSFNEMEEYVQEMFNAQRKAEFQSLKKSVDIQIPQIKSIIQSDMEKGLKGLMKNLKGPFAQLLNSGAHLSSYTKRVKEFFANLLEDLTRQSDVVKYHSPLLTPLSSALSALLSAMHDQRHFSADVSLRLAELQAALTTLTPTAFAEASPLLNVVKRGVRAFHGELAKQYVSRYSGKQITWVKDVGKPPKSEPTEEALKCGKVFFSCLQRLFDGLHELWQNCANKAAWEHKTISLTETAQHGNTITNPLGSFFKRSGYTVCSGPNKHNGELRNTVECRGGHIHQKLDASIRGIDSKTYKLVTKEDEEKEDKDSIQNHGLLKKLFDHLHDYYTVRHLPHFAARKYPCSVFDMLKWLCGLTSSTVYNDLTLNGFDVLFEKDEKETEAVTDFVVVEAKPPSLSAYPYDITSRILSGELAEVCHYSQDVLTCLLGNGHADGIYACEFNTNYDGFMYPGNMDTLLCMLREIVNRVYLQLHFLFQQCQYGTSLSGWLECEYGRDVGGSSWQCNTNQCADQKCKQIADQKRNQNCKLHPKCGVKSPLQSFLEDGLQGFLPHQIKYEKGKLECNVKSHAGIQCITPMGFADISHVASLTQTGHRIADVLAGFCGNQMSPLAKMCSLLNCAILSAPKTLGEMFAFYYGFLDGYYDGNTKRMKHRELPYAEAVKDANFKNDNNRLDITSMFKSSSHESVPASTHTNGDLFSLVGCNPKQNPIFPCGPYLQSLSLSIHCMFSENHADKYLSWIVYLTETFYDLLKKLFEDCKKHCGGDRPKCRVAKCASTCSVTTKTATPSHADSCDSIANCKATLPTLCRYGFTIGNLSKLSGMDVTSRKRTCNDFCKILGNAVMEGNTLHTLAHKIIPEFLFKIREPFIWLNVALWSLSLFYLFCVMVGRLDVLHIKSHLRSPSSHRITAQSLLAAAQVGRLAKISYLQP